MSVIDIKDRLSNMEKWMKKRLKDYSIEQVSEREKVSGQVLPIQFSNNDATKRVVMHSAKRVIAQHKAEIQELAYK